jgi:hypothetical protein
MKKLFIVPLGFLVLSCGENKEEQKKLETVIENERLLQKVDQNSQERKRLMDRLKFIELELETLQLKDSGSEEVKKEKEKLLNEVKEIMEKNKELFYEDSVALSKIKK